MSHTEVSMEDCDEEYIRIQNNDASVYIAISHPHCYIEMPSDMSEDEWL
jgi:hypothetical protein